MQFNREIFNYIPPFWGVSSLREASESLVGFRNYLDVSNPDAIFGLHENNFWVKIFFFLASEKNIKTYSLQEGIILAREESDMGKYSIGTDYTDTLFSWSSWDTSFYNDPDKILPVGPSHLDEWINTATNAMKFKPVEAGIRQRLGIPKKNKVVVFAPPRLDLYRGDFAKALNKIIEWTRDRGLTLILSFHPFQNGVEEFKKIPESYPHVIVRNDIQGLEYVLVGNVLITQTSTIAVESVLLRTPVIELDMDYVGLEQPLWKQGAADLLEGDNLDKITEVLEGQRANTKEFIIDRFPLADGRATKRIVEHILDG